MAEDIRRRAEREAAAIRREAAKWASDTRSEADLLRDQMVAQLAELERWTARLAEEHDELQAEAARHASGPDEGHEGHDDGVSGEVIDLRAAVARRAAADVDRDRVERDHVERDDVDHDVDDRERVDQEVDGATVGRDVTVTVEIDVEDDLDEDDEVDPHTAWRRVRSSVQGRGGPVETSLETKVHEVVRLAVRRTFERAYSAAGR